MPITRSSSRPSSAVQPVSFSSAGTRRPLTVATTSRLTSASKAAAAPSPSSSSSSDAAFHVFADLPDQLLCSPDNTVWVYGKHRVSLFTAEAAAQAKLERKVRTMMQEAQRHYDISCAFFHSLTSEEQIAEALRASGGGGGTPSPPSSTTMAAMATGASGKRDGVKNGDGPTMEKSERQRLAGVYRELRGMWPTWEAPDMKDAVKGLVTHQTGGVEDGGSSRNFYSAGLRVNLVLDIVASRKTMGTEPLHSRPYRLAEYLYQRIMQPTAAQPTVSSSVSLQNVALCTASTAAGAAPLAISGAKALRTAAEPGWADIAPHVRSLVIGISDAETTLVGCHVLCPYRYLSSPTPTLMRLRRAIEEAADQERVRAAAAMANTPASGIDAQARGSPAVEAAEGTASSPLCRVVAAQLARYGRVDALLTAPCVRVPPQSLGYIDQSRLILCTPQYLAGRSMTDR
ncbi:hypothetical protein LSCM1_08113 [Leishmania martiniquensis]|uniref:Uncharacterized protein n=1 Tax=Leishmania martiniquensis TaxID=1580590 RepID=A0A836KVZ0_9TRYP|nr:hypothetical protein LSCM1_08113 [Leishmania martiniquensis]